MSHRSFPLAVLLVALLMGLPGQSFATPMGSDASNSRSSDDDRNKLGEILKEIFTLGGIFSSGGGSRDSRRSAAETTEDDMFGDIFPLPIDFPNDPTDGECDPSAPVPEPTGALLFGMGILAVSAGRARLQRRR